MPLQHKGGSRISVRGRNRTITSHTVVAFQRHKTLRKKTQFLFSPDQSSDLTSIHIFLLSLKGGGHGSTEGATVVFVLFVAIKIKTYK